MFHFCKNERGGGLSPILSNIINYCICYRVSFFLLTAHWFSPQHFLVATTRIFHSITVFTHLFQNINTLLRRVFSKFHKRNFYSRWTHDRRRANGLKMFTSKFDSNVLSKGSTDFARNLLRKFNLHLHMSTCQYIEFWKSANNNDYIRS